MDCKINLEDPTSNKVILNDIFKCIILLKLTVLQAKSSDLGLVGKGIRRKFVVDQKTWKRLIGHYDHERSEGNIITIDENDRNENYIFLWNIPMMFNVMLVVLLFVAEYPLKFTFCESIQMVILTAVFATIFLVAVFPRNWLTCSWVEERLGCKGLRFTSFQIWLIIIMQQISLSKMEPNDYRVLDLFDLAIGQFILYAVCSLINFRISLPITMWQICGDKTDEECAKRNAKNKNYFATLFNISSMLLNLTTLMMLITFLGPYIMEQYQEINWLVKYDIEKIAALGLKCFLIGTPFVYYLIWFPCMIGQIIQDHKHYK